MRLYSIGMRSVFAPPASWTQYFPGDLGAFAAALAFLADAASSSALAFLAAAFLAVSVLGLDGSGPSPGASSSRDDSAGILTIGSSVEPRRSSMSLKRSMAGVDVAAASSTGGGWGWTGTSVIANPGADVADWAGASAKAGGAGAGDAATGTGARLRFEA